MQEIESTSIVKPKTKLVAWNFFHIKRYNDGCPSNTNKLNLSLPVMEIQAATFSIIYVVNILWFMPKFMMKINQREAKRYVF